MKMTPPDVISHENQLQHLSEPSIFMLDVFRTADHAGHIFIPHRLRCRLKNYWGRQRTDGDDVGLSMQRPTLGTRMVKDKTMTLIIIIIVAMTQQCLT